MDCRRKKKFLLILTALVFTGAVFVVSLCVGRFPLTLRTILSGDKTALRIFYTLRLPRTVMALITGMALGCAGFVYQLIFKNPLAAPDIIGVSSGSCAGAAAAILLLGASSAGITAVSFCGGLLAVFLTLGLSGLVRKKSLSAIVLSGVAVNALAQSFLMLLKYLADPEKELASIEYWTMGSFGSITASRLPVPTVTVLFGLGILFFLHRHLLMLTLDEDEARMLGVPVTLFRILALVLATLVTAAVVSVTGVISFVGLLAPHTARLLLKDNQLPAMLLSGLCGSGLLLAADVIARSIASSELPVSITTSVLGAPFLLWLILKGGRKWD